MPNLTQQLMMFSKLSRLRNDQEWRMAVRISGLFLLIGGGWILFSDWMVFNLTDNPETHVKLQLYKGWFFVVVVAFLLLVIIKGYLRRNRRLSDSLKESEARFKRIIEKSTSGICISNQEGVFEYVNPTFCRMYGYSPDELLGASMLKLVAEDKREAVSRLHRANHSNLSTGTRLFDVIDKSGNPKKVEVTSMPIVWMGDEGKILTFVTDVTENYRAEERLRQSEKKYRTMMEALDVPLFISDMAGKIEYLNPAFASRFGDVLGDFCYKTIMGKSGLCDWCKKLSSFNPGDKFLKEYHNMVDDRIYQVVVAALEYDPGQIKKMVILRDFTDIIHAREKAEEGDRLKTAFLANMSHEVRTPLNAILGFSGLLNDEKIPEEEKNRFVDLIHQSGIQLLNIIDDIVDVAYIEQGKMRISVIPVEVQPVLGEVMDIMKLHLVDGSKPDVELMMKNHLPLGYQVMSDPLRLKQILMNLMGNAIKFTKKGHVLLEVFEDNKHGVIFNVEDTGMGIPSDKLEVIFERFRQVDESTTRTFGGNGLGLFISKNLIEEMGGSITVQSTPGEGSVFSVALSAVN